MKLLYLNEGKLMKKTDEKQKNFFSSYSSLHHPTTVRSSSRERSIQLNGYVK
jgi:hypothetical protein